MMQILPPLGYKFSDDKPVFVNDEKALRDVWNGLGYNPPKGESCENMVKNLVDMGFEVLDVQSGSFECDID